MGDVQSVRAGSRCSWLLGDGGAWRRQSGATSFNPLLLLPLLLLLLALRRSEEIKDEVGDDGLATAAHDLERIVYMCVHS